MPSTTSTTPISDAEGFSNRLKDLTHFLCSLSLNHSSLNSFWMTSVKGMTTLTASSVLQFSTNAGEMQAISFCILRLQHRSIYPMNPRQWGRRKLLFQTRCVLFYALDVKYHQKVWHYLCSASLRVSFILEVFPFTKRVGKQMLIHADLNRIGTAYKYSAHCRFDL